MILFPFNFSFLLGLYLGIPAVITQIINLIAELVIPIEITTKGAKVEMEKHPVTAETKISICST